MAAINAPKTLPLTPLKVVKYGISEKKKSELDQLNTQVLNAQSDVDQFQAIVTSLTEKSNKLKASLATAESNRTQTLNNSNLADQLVQSVQDLKANAGIAFNEMILADAKTQSLANSIKSLMDKLIYSAQLINNLGNLVTKKKSLNPLISDDLVSMVGDAGKAANNAVSLTLIALKSAFAAQASNSESQAALALSFSQSMSLRQVLTGTDAAGQPVMKNDHPIDSLQTLLHDAYTQAKSAYNQTQKASLLTTRQLNEANTSLGKAQVKLKSLQSSLAAANAAALAS